jgi:uncharacterized protein YndB with AHSA1/START domain
MTLSPLIKSILVPLAPGPAFDLFTRRMAEWWPLGTHAVSANTLKAPASGVTVPPLVGGVVMETQADGTTAPWGTVTTFEPGHCFAMTWHPGHDPARATLVSVAFATEGTGTRVTLTHSGWDAREDGAAARQSYEDGWEALLSHDFARVAAAAPARANPGRRGQEPQGPMP